ncbi:MAG TPA: site-2 protease family protein [Candidatus Saccharimonadales bacterium]|nr:site-2 protease family protein [Candidatus Saccharimonadales bacterium]
MDIIYLLIALVMALTLHEFAHAFMGDYLGDQTARAEGRLTLNPAAHIDPFMTLLLPLMLILLKSPVIFGAAKPVPFNPWAVRYGKWGAALVAVAGPLTNLFIAVFFAVCLNLLPGGSRELFLAIIQVNLAFFVFNLIPFPPLDGSRVLYAAAPYGVRQVLDQIERAGLAAVALFLFVGFPLISPVMASIIGVIMGFLVPGSPVNI